jgi:hypothetical protein
MMLDVRAFFLKKNLQANSVPLLDPDPRRVGLSLHSCTSGERRELFLCDRVNMRAYHFVYFIEIFLLFRNGNPGGEFWWWS